MTTTTTTSTSTTTRRHGRLLLGGALALAVTASALVLAGHGGTATAGRGSAIGRGAGTANDAVYADYDDTTGGTAAFAGSTSPKPKANLIIEYGVHGGPNGEACTVYPNYPKAGVLGNDTHSWSVAPGDTVGWRYNINSTWSMISDKKYRNTGHPWWGIVRTSCIGTSLGGGHFPKAGSPAYPAGVAVPQSLLSGRSRVTATHYRHVYFRPVPGHVVDASRQVTSFGTLRDVAGRFAIGNVFPGWHVRVTDEHDGSWVKVYVSNAGRWGWIEDMHL